MTFSWHKAAMTDRGLRQLLYPKTPESRLMRILKQESRIEKNREKIDGGRK